MILIASFGRHFNPEGAAAVVAFAFLLNEALDYPLAALGALIGLTIALGTSDFPGRELAHACFISAGIGGFLGFNVDLLLQAFSFRHRARHGQADVDARFSDNNTSPFGSFHRTTETDNELFLRCLFSMCAKIAAADRKVSAEEIQEVERIARDVLLLDRPTQKAAMTIFYESSRGPVTLASLAEEFFNRFSSRKEVLVRLVHTLFEIAKLNQTIESTEYALIWDVARRFQLGEDEFDRLKAKYTGETDKEEKDSTSFSSLDLPHYQILGCTPQSSNREIKSKFRKLAKQFHPDRAGSSNDSNEGTTNKFRKIVNAYDYLRTIRNF